MTLFHTPTAFLMVSLAATLMPGITWIVLARHRSAAIDLWCGAGFVMAMSYTLIGLRGEAPTWVTYSLAYLLIFTHILLRSQSLRLDLARPWRPAWMILAGGIFITVYEGISQQLGSPFWQGIYGQVVYFLGMMYVARLALQIGQQEQSRCGYWIAGVYLLAASLMVFNTMTYLLGWPELGEVNSPAGQASLLVALIATLINHIAYMGLVLERSRRETAAVSQQTEAIIENASDGFFACDLDGRLSMVNPACCDLLGYSREELLGLRVFDLDVEQHPERDHPTVQRIMAQGSDQFETRYRRKDGTLVEVEASARFLAAGSGTFAVFLRDISERKRCELALQQAEASAQARSTLLKSILESPQGIIIFALDLDYRYTEFTQAHQDTMKKIWGTEIALGMNMLDAITLPDDRNRARQNFDRALRGESLVLHEEYGDPSRERVFHENRYSPILNADGVVLGITVYVIDITDRKQAEAALQREQTFSQAVMESIPGAFFVLDETTRFVRWNTYVRDEIFGHLAERDFMHISALDGLHRDDRELIISKIANVFTTGQAEIAEARLLLGGGPEFKWHLLTGQRMHIDGNFFLVGTGIDLSAQKQAQLALSESEAQFKSLADNSPLAIVILSADRDRAEYVNPSFVRLFGYTLDELPSMADWRALAYPDAEYRRELEAEWQNRARHAFDTHTPIKPVETRVTCKDGSCKQIQWGYQPLGERGYVFGLDLTDRRAAEQELREFNSQLELRVQERTAELAARTAELARLEERLRYAMEATSDGLWDWNLITHEVYYSPAYFRMLGYTPDEWSNHVNTWTELLHPDERDAVVAAAQERLMDPGYYEKEFRLRTRDGGYRWILSRGRVVEHDPAGRPLRAIGTHTDITERKQAELALQESEQRAHRQRQRLAEVIWATDAGTFEMNLQTGEETFNERWAGLLGYTLAELAPVRRETWFPFIDPDDLLRCNACLDRCIRQELDHYECEIRMRHRNGDWIWLLNRGRVVESTADGQPLRLAGTLQDITERKRAEQAVLDLNASLERKVAERTTQLALASQAKSEFLANMSHEIRTPMNAILGLTQILERDALTPDQRDLLHKISDAGTGLLHIINDILDFSKIEAGQLKVDQYPFNLTAVLESLTSLLAVSAFEKHLILSVPKLAAAEGRLIGDPLRVKQVLLNLASNAIKFTERGRVEIRVIRRLETATSVRLRFEVQDTGIGIAPEALAQLFQAFTQADASTTRRFGGTGLGLAISKRLVDLMGGEIGATSTPGVGSTFWFELPFGRAAMEGTVTAVMPSKRAVARQPQGPRLSGLRVLGVDDNRVNLFMLERALKLEGASVELAADGQQALQTLAAHPQGFDVVLMDIQMPVMDGLTAARAIRANAALTTLPIIALTAGVLSEERDATLAAGMNDFLAKPLDIEDMVAKLRLYLPERPAKALPESAAATPPPRQQTADPADQGDFPAIAGIDNVRVARLLGHDRVYFLRLLRLFIEEFESLPQQLGVDLARNDRETAIRRVHTLKGSAGNLGMMDLMRTAASLEAALREHAPNLDALIEPLSAELGALIEASAPWLSEAPAADAASTAPPLDPAQLEALQSALRHHDLAAINLHTSLEAALAGVFDAPTCKALAQAIGHLRFEEALQLLERGEPRS